MSSHDSHRYRSLRRILLGVVFLILGGGFVWLHHHLTYRHGETSRNTIGGHTLVQRSYLPHHFTKPFGAGLLPQTTQLLSDYTRHCHATRDRCLAYPGQAASAAFMRLTNIQYIGRTLDVTNTPQLTDTLNLTSDLQPYRSFVYELGVLLLPTNRSDDPATKAAAIDSALALGDKGIAYTCDAATIAAITGLDDQAFFAARTDASLAHPCQSHVLPYNLGFASYFYAKNNNKATDNYRIAAMHDDAPRITSSMASLISRNSGDRRTSMQLAYYQYIADTETARDTTDSTKQDLLIAQAQRSLHRAIESYLLLTLTDITSASTTPTPPDQLTIKTLATPLHQTITEQIATCQQSRLPSIQQPPIECVILAAALEQGYITHSSKTTTLTCPAPSDTSDYDFVYKQKNDQSDRSWYCDPVARNNVSS